VRFPWVIIGMAGEPMGFFIASLMVFALSSTPGVSFNKQIFNKIFLGIVKVIFYLT
jgi:hypothetical protein